MSRFFVRMFFAGLLSALAIGCNISDEGGGIDVECLEDSECPDGRCSNGICIDISTNNDAGGNTTTADMAVVMDSGMPEDMGTTEDMSPDMPMQLECPDGLIDFNLNPDDGCETVTFPGWDIAACKACAGIPNAVAGCGAGNTCVIAACADGFFDRDGDPANGCETTCAPGECWSVVTAEHDEAVFVDGPNFWFYSSESGLVGREFTEGDIEYHSLDGPRDFVADSVEDLHVVDEVIYARKRDLLVRSVDHGRSFGQIANLSFGSVIDINEGADGRYYLLTTDQSCELRACNNSSDCLLEPECSMNESVCGSGACATDIDCGPSRRCTADGICVFEPSGCRTCTNPDSCAGATYQVFVTNNFSTFMPVGPALPQGAGGSVVHGTLTGFPIITQAFGLGEDVIRLDPLSNQWVPVESRNCPFQFMFFLQSGDGVGIGDQCSYEYEARDGKFNNRENIDGLPLAALLHRDVVYVAGDRFIASSGSFGGNYEERNLSGKVIHLYADTDDTIVAIGSLGEVWRSVDQGQSWNQEKQARQPFPRQVETGSPLALVGLAQQGGVITPSSAGATAPWTVIGTQSIDRIKQTQGAAFGFSNNPPLYSGTDWQSLNPMSVSTQTVNSGAWPACSGLPCRILRVDRVLDATYDGNEMFVLARVVLQVRPSPLAGWQTVGSLSGVLRSSNGVSWTGVQYIGSATPQFLAAADFGLVTDRGYSIDGSQWFSTGTPECGTGPFFRGPNGGVVGFGDGNVCTTSDGATWQLLTEDFWPIEVSTVARDVDLRNGAFFVTIDVSGSTAVNASDDGMTWRSVGPRWPSATDIAFGSNSAAAAHPKFFAISN